MFGQRKVGQRTVGQRTIGQAGSSSMDIWSNTTSTKK